MPGYEKIESLKNGGSWGQFCWKTCGFERVKLFVSTDIPASHEFASQFGLAIFFIGEQHKKLTKTELPPECSVE